MINAQFPVNLSFVVTKNLTATIAHRGGRTSPFRTDSSLCFLKIAEGRAIYDLARSIEAGTVARTIPRFLNEIPTHNTTQMRTNRGALVQSPFCVAISRHQFKTAPHHRAFAIPDFIGRSNFTAGQQIAILDNYIRVFARVTMRRAQGLAARIVQGSPPIRLSEN